MLVFVSFLVVAVCLLLIAAVLIQNPKEGGIDSTMGGNVSNQIFGAAGSADLVEKVTWYLAAGLFALCMLAAVISNS